MLEAFHWDCNDLNIDLYLQAIALIVYIMATELFDARSRIRGAVSLSFFWASGIILLALFGYLVRDWRHLELLISIPNFLTVLYIW